MFIERLAASSFRNFSSLELNLNPYLNVFVGHNGSGKSSIVESFYLLGFGRSFRTNKLKSCIAERSNEFVIFAKTNASHTGSSINAGLAKSAYSDITCQINGDKGKRLSDLVKLFPIQLFTPQSTDLVLGSPKDRRKFLDWGVFHVEHSFETLSRNFKVALKNRNALLKKEQLNRTLLLSWNERFSELGEALSQQRELYLQHFVPIFNLIQREFLKGFNVEIEYNTGWKADLPLAKALESRRQQDLQFKVSTVGPHKADLRFKIDGKDAAEVLSRGQLRMLVAALLLAQAKAYKDKTGKETIFLLDDIGAELDEYKRELFLDELVNTGSQIVVTSIDMQQLKFINKYDNKKMFHVEHGSVKEE